MLDVLRCSLMGEVLPTVEDWQATLSLARRQGVDALINSAGLPATARLQAAAYAAQQQENYERQRNVLARLTGIFSPAGMKTAILKGFALAQYWSQPALRPCGDIDIFLGEDYEKGNHLLEQLGATVDCSHGSKHSSASLDGITIENHRTLCNYDEGGVDAQVELFIYNCIKAQGLHAIGEGAYGLPPVAECLFVLNHTVRHFASHGGIVLRHVADWGFLLRHYQAAADGTLTALGDAARQMGLDAFCDIISAIAADWGLCRPLRCFALSDDALATAKRRVLQDFFDPKDLRALPHNLKGLWGRYRRFGAIRWKYRYLPGSWYRAAAIRLRLAMRKK